MARTLPLGVGVLLGLGALANGALMLLNPAGWYVAVPGVTSTGPFNPHFVRDIGLIFLLLGGALLVGAARAESRVVLWGAAALWLSGHALFHLWEVAAGLCAPADLVRDFPAVSLPAILAIALTVWAATFARPRTGDPI